MLSLFYDLRNLFTSTQNIEILGMFYIHNFQDPDMASIERLHAQYSAALVELYNKYNPIYGDSSVKLVIT